MRTFVKLFALLVGVILLNSCSKDNSKAVNTDLPTVITAEASGITSNFAISGGNVTAGGIDSVISRGICWSKSSNPTIKDNKTVDGAGVGVFTSNISSLESSTKYYIRAYATNSAGTAYGNQVAFITLEEPDVTAKYFFKFKMDEKNYIVQTNTTSYSFASYAIGWNIETSSESVDGQFYALQVGNKLRPEDFLSLKGKTINLATFEREFSFRFKTGGQTYYFLNNYQDPSPKQTDGFFNFSNVVREDIQIFPNATYQTYNMTGTFKCRVADANGKIHDIEDGSFHFKTVLDK